MLAYLYWPIAVLLAAYGQGVLLPAIRRTAPGAEAKRQSFGLHTIGSLAYFLPLVFVPTWPHVAVAAVSRLILFDVVINLASGKPAFYIGQTAATDKLLRKLGGAKAGLLSAGLRLAALVGVVIWLLLF